MQRSQPFFISSVGLVLQKLVQVLVTHIQACLFRLSAHDFRLHNLLVVLHSPPEGFEVVGMEGAALLMLQDPLRGDAGRLLDRALRHVADAADRAAQAADLSRLGFVHVLDGRLHRRSEGRQSTTIQLAPNGLVGKDVAKVLQAHFEPLHPGAEETESPRADLGAGGAAAAAALVSIIAIQTTCRSGTCCAGRGISCLTSSKETSDVQSLPRLL